MDEIVSSIVESPVRTCAASLAAISIGYLARKSLQHIITKNDNTRLYPPGPPRDPIIGAMRRFPKGFPSQRFNEWAIDYGVFGPRTEGQ
jgi:hypothetical protein